jgi:hypothetical protein
MDSPLQPDPKVIRDALKVLGVGPGYVTELRVLNARDQPNSPFPYTFGGYFDDPEKLIRALLTIKFATGFYIMPNPCRNEVLARFNNRAVRLIKGDGTSDRDILRRRWLLVDTDPVRMAGISSTDEEHELALTRAREIDAHLHAQGWPDPIVADSGNGGHLLYPIDLPVDDGGLVKRCLQALDQRLSDDRVKVDTSVHNPSRIWKLYGTPVRKGDSTPERPHRMARLLKVPDGY